MPATCPMAVRFGRSRSTTMRCSKGRAPSNLGRMRCNWLAEVLVNTSSMSPPSWSATSRGRRVHLHLAHTLGTLDVQRDVHNAHAVQHGDALGSFGQLDVGGSADQADLA